MKRSLAQNGLLTLKGIAMGAADIVPGVSGGTIAFITGIYEELISSINNINLGIANGLAQHNHFTVLVNTAIDRIITRQYGGFSRAINVIHLNLIAKHRLEFANLAD